MSEPLEQRRLLSTTLLLVPKAHIPSLPGETTNRSLRGGLDSQWQIQNRGGTTNGLPSGGSTTLDRGLAVFEGSIGGGAQPDAFDFGHSIWVNNQMFQPPGDVVTVDDDGEPAVMLSAGPAPMSGLNVTMEYHAAQASATLRTVVTFENGGTDAVSVPVTWAYNLGSDDQTTLHATSSGDTNFTPADRWIVTDDTPASGLGRPAVTGVLYGTGNPRAVPVTVSGTVFNAIAKGTQGVLADYHITIPAGGSGSLMFFTQLNPTEADGRANTAVFDTSPRLENPLWQDLLAGMNQAQLDSLLNWQINTPPVATDDAVSANEDQPLEAPVPGVLGNDTDADGNAITVSAYTQPEHGTVTVNADGSFTYTPAANFNGTDHFTYRATDTIADSNDAVVTVTVAPVNDAPTFSSGAAPTSGEDGGPQSVDGWATGMSAGPADEAGQSLSFLVENDNPALFSEQPAVDAAGRLTYKPAPDANGSATVAVRLVDDGGTDRGGSDTSAAHAFTLTVTEANDAPAAGDDAAATDEDVVLILPAAALLSNDSAGPANEAGQALSIVVVAATADTHGSVTVGDGVISYTPDPDYHGPAAFLYTLSDDGTTAGASDPLRATGSVLLTVGPVNDAPSVAVASAAVTVSEGQTARNTVTFSDVDSAAVTLSASLGSVSLDEATGQWLWTYDAADDLHALTVSITADDGAGGASTATFSLTVNNAAPKVAAGAGATAAEGTAFRGTGSFTDAGGLDTWLATVDYGDGSGPRPLTLNPDHTFALEHTYADNGLYTVAVKVGDDDGGTGEGTLHVSVSNATPVLGAVAATSVNESGVSHLTGTISDDGAADSFTLEVNWGDGSAVETLSRPAGTTSFDLTHAYRDDNPSETPSDAYLVTVKVIDDDGGNAGASAGLTVSNVAPSITSVDGLAAAVRGQTVGYSLAFADIGLLDTHTATIDWGDGASSAASVSETIGSGTGTASAGHAYAGVGTYTIVLRVRDDDGGFQQVTRSIEVRPVDLQPDPCNPGGMVLYVVGTPGNDLIQLIPSSQAGKLEVVVNGVNFGAFAQTARFAIYAGAGDDTVQGAGAVTAKTWMYGEDGNDILNLGNGGGLAFGGFGNDQINGGSGRDVMVGGEGADKIVSNPGDDILISAITRYDDRFAAVHEEAWCSIYAEWSNTARTFRQRVDNVRAGTGTATRLNGAFYLNDSTVDDDSAPDVIGSSDVLTGASGEDWFIYKGGEDKVSTMTSAEASEDLLIT